MKKLNNQEINAIAGKIQSEIVNSNVDTIKAGTKCKEVWEKEFKKTTKYKEFIKIDSLINSFKDIYKFNMSGWLDRSERIPSFISQCYKQYTKEVEEGCNLKYPSLESIKNKIIIAQIECENLQEIIDSIKKEYNLIVE